MNNFFINIKLLIILKDFGISRYKTVKTRSKFLFELLKIYELSIKKGNYGMKIYTTSTKDIFCFIWQNLELT